MLEQPSSTGEAFGVTNPGVTPTTMEGDDRRPGDSSEGQGTSADGAGTFALKNPPASGRRNHDDDDSPPFWLAALLLRRGGVFAPITFSLQSLIFAVAPEMKLQWEPRGRLAPALFTVSSIIQIPNTPPHPPPPRESEPVLVPSSSICQESSVVNAEAGQAHPRTRPRLPAVSTPTQVADALKQAAPRTKTLG